MPNTTREQRKAEAIDRLKMLNLHPNVLQEFVKEDKLNKSEFMGILYWLDDEEEKLVKQFEEQNNATVYTAILSHTSIGDMLSLLYVSDYPEEWEMDRSDLAEGYPVVYVANLTYDDCSEFGSIGIKAQLGGLVRTA